VLRQRWGEASRFDRAAFRVVVAGYVVILLCFLGYLTLPAFGSVSQEALLSSVANRSGSDAVSSLFCERRRGGYSECHVAIPISDSETATYRVRMVGQRCWRAVLGDEAGLGLELRPHGCVKLRDQIRLWSRVL
jgi:hypothetical protein